MTKIKRKKSMKKNRKIFLQFIIYFVFLLVFNVIISNYRSFRGEKPNSFYEIFDNFWVFVLFTLFGAIVMILKSQN